MESESTLNSLIFLLCFIISIKNQKADGSPLQLEYYSLSCPTAEQIIRSTMQELYKNDTKIAPALLRLIFHECFVGRCDASVLLDARAKMDSEKESPLSVGLQGYAVIDTIKARLEDACPGIVSCADIIAVATRDGVVLAGGFFYPVLTGRRDSNDSFPNVPLCDVPFPQSKSLTHLDCLHPSLFEMEFGKTMFKLSNLDALTAPSGEVRLNCRKRNL